MDEGQVDRQTDSLDTTQPDRLLSMVVINIEGIQKTVKSVAQFVLIYTITFSVYCKTLTEAQGTSKLHDEYCKNFSYGNPQALEFYSPKYPKNYPAEIKCQKEITADYGYFVRIDFRDSFQIEPPSNEGKCEYDYLEVTDFFTI